VEAERRQLVILFADMVGFSTFSQEAGEEASFALMQSLARLMTGPVHDQGGGVQRFTGDGVFAVFGAPIAFEDAPLRACRAALAILRGLADSGGELEAKHGLRPQVRIGISTGPAVFGEVKIGADASATVLGDAVNVAARLQSIAEPGTAVMSSATHRLVDGLVHATFVGEHEIKGRTGAESVYRLDSIRSHTSRFDATLQRGLTAYVGRDRELEKLQQCLEVVGAGIQMIDIVGEPGIGKSRLLYEFREQVVRDRAQFLTGNCTLDGQQTPFRAFIEIVGGAFHLASGEAEASVARKLDEGLHELGLRSDENLALLLNLLGLPASEGALGGLDGVLIGLRTRDLLKQIIEARARSAPLVLVIEDLNWLDSASEELLSSVMAITERLRLLILLTRRVGYDPPWVGRAGVTRLFLEPLSVRETSRIAQARLGVEEVPEALSKLIAAKAEGNALFAEEIGSFLIERGIVRRGAKGLEFDAAAVAGALPESVQSLLASRVDQLAPADRTMLQTAAVVGRRFDPDLVATLSAPEGRGEASFAAVEALDLIRRDPLSSEYLFKHALVREALYNGLLSGPRAALHLRVADELERRGGNRLFEIAESLALHYAAAERAEKAFAYLAMAGHKSLNVYATPEAERYCRRALDVFETKRDCASPPAVVRVVVRLLETLMLKGDYRDAGNIARKFMPFIRGAGESPDLVVASYYQALSLAQNFELRLAHDLMVEALTVADRLGDGRARAYARCGLLQCRIRLGLDSLEDADRMKAQLLEDSRRFGDTFIRNASFYFASWDYCYRGLVKEARETAMRLFASGRERNDPRAIGLAHWILGWTDVIGGAPEAALAQAEECLRAAIAPFDRLQGEIIRTISIILLGRWREGLERLDALNSEFERLGLLYNILHLPRGYALITLGRISEGVDIIKKNIGEREAAGDSTLAAFGRIALAEFYIQALSGKRERRPAGAVIFKNLGAVIATLLFGARRAKALLEEVASHRQLSEHGIVIARVNLNLGLLHATRRKFEKARSHLEKARAIAEGQGAEALLRRIDTALLELG
jgi:class 3 adenylate cyclase